MLLKTAFFQRSTLEVARDLIGAELYHKKGATVTSGMIVETEAYLGRGDPASHSYRGETRRNSEMFQEGGIAYVYFTYGNHFCFNIVTETKGVGSAVLIRALEPKKGIPLMRRRRSQENLRNLASGPGKLTQAFGIGLQQNGSLLKKGDLWIEKEKDSKVRVVSTPRIGISQAVTKPYRFIDMNSDFLSRKHPKKKRRP